MKKKLNLNHVLNDLNGKPSGRERDYLLFSEEKKELIKDREGNYITGLIPAPDLTMKVRDVLLDTVNNIVVKDPKLKKISWSLIKEIQNSKKVNVALTPERVSLIEQSLMNVQTHVYGQIVDLL